MFSLDKIRSLLLTLTKVRLDCHIRDVPTILSLAERMRLLEWCSCEMLLLDMIGSDELMIEFVHCMYRAMEHAYHSEISTQNREA